MDVQDLFLSCRRGDLNRVQFLVEQREVDLNVRDKWDSTPLYYACLCGHEELVNYVLKNGARCEANTFDGERCLYGALSNKIRSLLRCYKAVTSSTIRRDLYSEFLRKSLERDIYGDIRFLVHGEVFTAHRCVLAARCRYFAELLETKWKDRTEIHVTHKLVFPWAFKAVLQYLYTARLEAQIEQLDDIFRVAKQCRLETLMTQLEDKMKDVCQFESTKPGVNVTVLCLEPSADCSQLNNDLNQLADSAIPNELCNQEILELPFAPLDELELFPDVIFQVQDHKFMCHKLFFCGRSDYFKALVEDHFGESWTEAGDLPVVPLHELTADVFIHILYYIYTDNTELDGDNVYEVLCAADIMLLPGLKRHCATVMARHIDADNIVTILKTARLFNLPRLEDQGAEFIASNIEKVLQNEEFASFVKEDAESVLGRQETDSIPIIDDVRFHITNFVQTFSDMYDADQKLAMIDCFLEELGLDA